MCTFLCRRLCRCPHQGFVLTPPWRITGAGGMLATKQDIRAYPTRTNQIPRHIPPPHWASHPAVLFLAAGLLPFGTIFVELYFAMTSIWQVLLHVYSGLRIYGLLPFGTIFVELYFAMTSISRVLQRPLKSLGVALVNGLLQKDASSASSVPCAPCRFQLGLIFMLWHRLPAC